MCRVAETGGSHVPKKKRKPKPPRPTGTPASPASLKRMTVKQVNKKGYKPMTPNWQDSNEVAASVRLRCTRRITTIGVTPHVVWSSHVEVRHSTNTERQKGQGQQS